MQGILTRALDTRRGLRCSYATVQGSDFWGGHLMRTGSPNGATASVNRIATIRLTKRTLLLLRRRTVPTPTWEIGAKWQYRTGNPYTPVLGANLRADPRNGEPIYIPIYGATNSARFPPYHRLDVKLSKAFRFESWEMRLFLELLNIYNRKNLLDFNYTEDYSDKDEIYQFPILPYLGVTTEF